VRIQAKENSLGVQTAKELLFATIFARHGRNGATRHISCRNSPIVTVRQNETDTSLDFALDWAYITETEHRELTDLNTEVCSMLGLMIKNPTPFLIVDR